MLLMLNVVDHPVDRNAYIIVDHHASSLHHTQPPSHFHNPIVVIAEASVSTFLGSLGFHAHQHTNFDRIVPSFVVAIFSKHRLH